MSILITGGAGFIGCHSARLLSESGHPPVVLDNLTTGRRSNVRWGPLVEGDIADVPLVRRVLREHHVTAVLHLAASAHVGESMANPGHYFSNNVAGTVALLDAMLAEGVRGFVFASSCSVYGQPGDGTVGEDDAVHPLSPYGESKRAVERTLPWYEHACGLRWIALRYFNAAGAEQDLGEDTATSLRIVPRALAAALGVRPPLQIFGASLPTPDGTAVRDYVHVADIARANLLALRYVEAQCPGAIVNIGKGVGTSVRQIVESVGREFGCPVPVCEREARPGDPAAVVANVARAAELLGWAPCHSDLESIVASAAASHRLQSARV